jgi:hypothetical protein
MKATQLVWPRITMGAMVLLLLGCDSDSITLTNPDHALLRVALNSNAITLATVDGYNTFQLSTVAYRGNGEVIPDIVPIYSSGDNTVHVDANGLVTGLKATVKAPVVVHVTYDGITRSDTAWITVVNTTTPSPLSTFTISVPDTLSAGITTTVTVSARNTSNPNLPLSTTNIPIHYRVSDDRVATIDRSGRLTTLLPERSVTIYATTTYYGVTYTDSAVVIVGYPSSVAIFVAPRITITGQTILEFIPNTIYLAAGGVVIFCNCYNDIPNSVPIDVVFDNPEKAHALPPGLFPTGEGNIPSFMRTNESPLGAYQTRMFPEPGTYHYHSEQYGSSGKLIVK